MSISVEPHFIELVDEHCHKGKISRSLFIREAIRAALGSNSSIKLGHTSTKKIRAMREDGKCNPFIVPMCAICHGDDEE